VCTTLQRLERDGVAVSDEAGEQGPHRAYLELMQQWTRLKEDEGDFALALVVDAELFRPDSSYS
jgi:hypothetical protein